MIKALVIADDFTGALDSGVKFSAAGASTKLTLDPGIDFSAVSCEVLVLCTPTRHLPPQDAYRMLLPVAERAAAEYGVQFLYRDFRPYFKDGQNFAREHGFYMQKYCGCVFSEEERYIKAKKLIP